MPEPEVKPAQPSVAAAPALPPLPTTEGDLREIHKDIREIKEALALLCGKAIMVETKLAEAQPLIDQIKAKVIDPKTGKLKWWPF